MTTFSLEDLVKMAPQQRQAFIAWIESMAAQPSQGTASTQRRQPAAGGNGNHPVLPLAQGLAQVAPFRLDTNLPSFSDDRDAAKNAGWSWNKAERAMVPPGWQATH